MRNKKNNLHDLLRNIAKEGIKKQNKDGSMSAGHNGPYFHPETSIRNTCHWLIVFLKAYRITKSEKFLASSQKCVDYLLKNKPKYNYHHRSIQGKDKCNGLVGPAWTMEALLFASRELERKDLSDLASEVFYLHKFDEKRGLWHRREVDGAVLPVDWTFNHQLWFASIGSMLDKKDYTEIHAQVNGFIQKLPANFDIYRNGLVWHPIAKKEANLNGLMRFLQQAKKSKKSKREDYHKAIGYHQFNLYAFAILKENYPDLAFWRSKKFKKALEFLESGEYEKGLINNQYGFDYNVAGIETAYTLKIFRENSEKLQKYWLEKQFQRNYDFDKNLLCKHTDDPETLSARIYETARLDNIEMDLISKKPFVSVIIPTYNDSKRIKKCVDCLLDQSYPNDKYEIIVVDNNSSDNTVDILKKYPIKLLHEKEIQSSYAARNKGLKEAKGEIVAFTDSDCQPAKEWIENGVRGMLSEKADLMAGKVSFLFQDKNDPYEICDSIEHMQQERAVGCGVAATANLFVRKKLFNELGFFNSNVKSGGDGVWTYNATSKGRKLVYFAGAEVFHPTRKKEEILKKKKRTGYGNIASLINKNKTMPRIITSTILGFIPPVRINVEKIQAKKTIKLLLKIYYAKWLSHFYYNSGKIQYLRDNFLRNKKR